MRCLWRQQHGSVHCNGIRGVSYSRAERSSPWFSPGQLRLLFAHCTAWSTKRVTSRNAVGIIKQAPRAATSCLPTAPCVVRFLKPSATFNGGVVKKQMAFDHIFSSVVTPTATKMYTQAAELVTPLYVVTIPAGFYFLLWTNGVGVEKAREDGWLFPRPRSSHAVLGMWELFDMSRARKQKMETASRCCYHAVSHHACRPISTVEPFVLQRVVAASLFSSVFVHREDVVVKDRRWCTQCPRPVVLNNAGSPFLLPDNVRTPSR